VTGGEPQHSPAGVLATLRTLPRPVVVLLAGIAVNRIASFVALFLILYLIHLGFGVSAAGLVVTAFGVGSIVGAYLGGRLSDRFGPRWAIAASMVGSAAMAITIAATHDYAVLFAASALDGVFTQCFRPPANAMIADLTPPDRLVVMTAASRLGLNVGATVAPLLGVWLITFSYGLLFIVDAATSLLFGLAVVVALPGQARSRQPDPAAARSRGRPGRPGIARDTSFLLVLAGMFAVSIAEIQYQVTLPLQIRYQHLPPWLYGAVVALNGAIVISCELPLTRLVRRLPFRVAIAGGTFAIGVGISLFGISAQIWVFILGTVIWTVGEMVSSPSLTSYPALIASPPSRGRYIAALTAAQAAGYAAGPIIGTTLLQVARPLVWLACAALGAVAFGCMITGVRYDPVRQQPPGRTSKPDHVRG
jgi:MFS family permease